MCLEFKKEDLSEEIVWESIYPTCDIIRYEKGHTTSFKKCLPNKQMNNSLKVCLVRLTDIHLNLDCVIGELCDLE